MKDKLKILLLEDSKVDAEIIQRLILNELGDTEFRLASDKKTFLTALDEFIADVILSDNKLPAFNATEALSIVNQRSLDIPFILITGTVSEEFAANIIKQGADDYILKDRLIRLPGAIESALKHRAAEKQKKEAIEQLRLSEMRLTKAQSIAHISNWEVNLMTNEHIWSDELYRIFGIEKGTLKPFPELFLSLMHPDDVGFASKKVQDAFSTFENDSFDFRFIRKNRSIRHGYTEWKFEFDKIGTPIRLFGILQDITERKAGEEEVRKTNERFRYATKATSDIIWEINFETKDLQFFEGKEKLFAPNTLIDWNFGVQGSYILKEDLENVRARFSAAKKDKSITLWDMEYRVISAKNEILSVVNNAFFIRNENGKAIRAIGALTDITEKKKLQQKLLEQHRQEQIKITATALKAQEKERHSIGIELHDNVNQILVSTNIFLSQAKTKPEKAEEMINMAMKNLQDAIEENRKIAHVFVAPDLESESFTDQLNNLTLNMISSANMTTEIITAQFDEDLLDSDRKINIYRIAQEQFTNIVKYSKATSVHLDINTTKEYFNMTISDNGVGMDTTKKTTGIGLKNIQGRLSVFNGSAKIVSAPHEGFVLKIKVPLKDK